MFRFSVACFLLMSTCLVGQAQETPNPKAVVKKLVEEIRDATLKGDYTRVVDSTYDSFVKELGGRKKAITTITSMMNQMKANGVTLKAYGVGEPGTFHVEGNNTFVVIPTTLKMTIPNGKMSTKSFLLGISPDKGKSWKFVDGAGFAQNKVKIIKMLPKMPAKLKIPEMEKPTIIRDE